MSLYFRLPRAFWSHIFWHHKYHKHRHLSWVPSFRLKKRVSRPVEKGPTMKPLMGLVSESFGSGLLRTLDRWPQPCSPRMVIPNNPDIVTSQQSPPQRTGTNWNGQEDKRQKQNMTFSELRSQLKRPNRTLWGLQRRPPGLVLDLLCPLRGFCFSLNKKKQIWN